jgi:transposase
MLYIIIMQGYTITEIAGKLDISYITAKQRLLRAGIKPITKDALYSMDVLEILRKTPGKGRPKKTAPETKPKKAAKGKK